MSSNCCCSSDYTQHTNLYSNLTNGGIYFFFMFFGVSIYIFYDHVVHSVPIPIVKWIVLVVSITIFGVIQIGFGSLRVETGRSGLPRDLIFTALVLRYCTRRSTTTTHRVTRVVFTVVSHTCWHGCMWTNNEQGTHISTNDEQLFDVANIKLDAVSTVDIITIGTINHIFATLSL